MNMNKYLGIDSFGKRPDGTEMTHHEKYSTLVNAIGLNKLIPFIPADLEQVKKALAEGEGHLNEIPIKLWDNKHTYVRSLAGQIIGEREGSKITYTWSISQSVCLLKTAAKMWAGGES
jgi:hypothetical protein